MREPSLFANARQAVQKSDEQHVAFRLTAIATLQMRSIGAIRRATALLVAGVCLSLLIGAFAIGMGTSARAEVCTAQRVAGDGCCPGDRAGFVFIPPQSSSASTCCRPASLPHEAFPAPPGQQEVPSPLLDHTTLLPQLPSVSPHAMARGAAIPYRPAVFDLKTDMRI